MTRADQIAQLPEYYLECRAWRHQWKGTLVWGAFLPGEKRVHKGWATEEKFCIRCSASCVTIYDGQLQMQTTTITYPDNYLIHGQRTEAPSREAKREVLRRAS